MSFHCSPRAPYGSLLKQPDAGKKKRKPFKQPREHDGRHLAAVRRCPCLSCDNDPAGEAAHVRMTVAGKAKSGIGVKPDDKYTLPLCSGCHTRKPDAQHNIGEVAFWNALGLDPLVIAARLYAVSPDVPKMREVVFAAREDRK